MSIPRHPGHFFRAACPFTPLHRSCYGAATALLASRQVRTLRPAAPYSVARSGEFRGASHEAAPYNFMRDSTGLPNYRQAIGQGLNWFATALQASATVLGISHFPRS